MVVITIESKQTQMAKEIERVRFELTESKIHVKFIKKFSGFNFEGIVVPPASKGSHLEIPYFIADFLRKQSIIEDFTLEFPTSLTDLTRTVRSEVRLGKIQPLHPFFNVLVKEQILAENDIGEDSQFDEVELKRKQSKFNQLIHERATKIVKMAEASGTAPRKTDLTLSEEILYKKLIDLVQSWKAEFIQKIG